MCWCWQFVKFKFSRTGRNTSIQSEINSMPPLPPPTLFDFLSLSCFSYLFFPVIIMWAAANVIAGGSGWVCVYGGGRGGNCYACTTKCNIKKLLSEKGTFWQMYGGGQLPPYVCGDRDNKSGSNYQSSSGEPVKMRGLAHADKRCHGDKPTSQQVCVYQDIKNTLPYFYHTHNIM